MYKMVEEISVRVQGKTVERKLLYLTNKQVQHPNAFYWSRIDLRNFLIRSCFQCSMFKQGTVTDGVVKQGSIEKCIQVLQLGSKENLLLEYIFFPIVFAWNSVFRPKVCYPAHACNSWETRIPRAFRKTWPMVFWFQIRLWSAFCRRVTTPKYRIFLC